MMPAEKKTQRYRLSGGMTLLAVLFAFLLMLGVFLLFTGGHLFLDVYSYELGAESVGVARIDLSENGSFPYITLNINWPCGRILLMGWDRDYYEIRDTSGILEGDEAMRAGPGADDPANFYVRACSSRRGFGVLDEIPEKDLMIFFPKGNVIPNLEMITEELRASGITVRDMQVKSGDVSVTLSDCAVRLFTARGVRVSLEAESVTATRIDCIGYLGDCRITGGKADCINIDFVTGNTLLRNVSATSVIGKAFLGFLDISVHDAPKFISTELIFGSVRAVYPTAQELTVDAHAAFGNVAFPDAAELYAVEEKEQNLPFWQRLVQDFQSAATRENNDHLSFDARYGERTCVFRGRSAVGDITVSVSADGTEIQE